MQKLTENELNGGFQYRRPRASFTLPKNQITNVSENFTDFVNFTSIGESRHTKSTPDLDYGREQEVLTRDQAKIIIKRYRLSSGVIITLFHRLEGRKDVISLRMRHKTLKFIQKLDNEQFQQQRKLFEEEKKLEESGKLSGLGCS